MAPGPFNVFPVAGGFERPPARHAFLFHNSCIAPKMSTIYALRIAGMECGNMADKDDKLNIIFMAQEASELH